MRIRYLRSFDSSFSTLEKRDQDSVESAIGRLLDYFSGASRPMGLGLRKLKGHFWEIRASLDKRILFKMEGGLATFIIAGNHDEISRFLRRQ